MAISVLGLGIPASSPLVPDERREALKKALDNMDEDMNSSPYDWEFFAFTPDMDAGLLSKKLQEKKWDIVMVGSKSTRESNSYYTFLIRCSGSSPRPRSHSILRADYQHGA